LWDRREIERTINGEEARVPFAVEGNPEMTRIKLDTDLAARLHDLAQVAELCDPSGRVLGQFVPRVDLSEWEPVSPEVSEEELDRRARSGARRYSTAEVLATLERL
jgi:hypothetical protein